MLNDISSPLALLETRRSGRPRDLVAPGPDAAQLRRILAIAARTPDHGKLVPWRFVHVRSEDRSSLFELLKTAFEAANPAPMPAEVEAVHRFAHQAPTLVVILSSPVANHKIPLWEQQLSCGAACMNLLHAATALGFAGGWVTGWPTYSPDVLGAFCREGERIAGFLFIGTPAQPLEERPRPSIDNIVSDWRPF